jgi:hypothetical protein
MTKGSPNLGDDTEQENRETESESSPELTKIEPRPEEDDADHDTHESEESDDDPDDGEGEEIAEDDDDDDDDTDDEEDEPKLKYARLTQHLSAVYRNGDMTSAFLVAGDKMIAGTHNGNIVSFDYRVFYPLVRHAMF